MFPDECIPLPIYLNFYNVQFLSIAMLGNVSLLMALLQGNGHPELVMVALLKVLSNFMLQ